MALTDRGSSSRWTWLSSRGIPYKVACLDVEPRTEWFMNSTVRRVAGHETPGGFTGDLVVLPRRSRHLGAITTARARLLRKRR